MGDTAREGDATQRRPAWGPRASAITAQPGRALGPVPTPGVPGVVEDRGRPEALDDGVDGDRKLEDDLRIAKRKRRRPCSSARTARRSPERSRGPPTRPNIAIRVARAPTGEQVADNSTVPHRRTNQARAGTPIVDRDQRHANDGRSRSAPAPAKSSRHVRDRQQADQADDDDDGLDDTTGDVAERERLALAPDDGPRRDRGADVGNDEEDPRARPVGRACRPRHRGCRSTSLRPVSRSRPAIEVIEGGEQRRRCVRGLLLGDALTCGSSSVRSRAAMGRPAPAAATGAAKDAARSRAGRERPYVHQERVHTFGRGEGQPGDVSMAGLA